MIAQGVQLMIIGMSVVFMFLIVLVVFMSLTAAIVKYFPGQAATESAAVSSGATKSASAPDASGSKLQAALAAVSVHHRRRNRK